MESRIYCFFDRVSQTFLPQFFCITNDDVAKRSFRSFVKNSQFPYKDIIDDLQIYSLAIFNPEMGITDNTKEFICNLADLKEE